MNPDKGFELKVLDNKTRDYRNINLKDFRDIIKMSKQEARKELIEEIYTKFLHSDDFTFQMWLINKFKDFKLKEKKQ